MTMLLWIAPIAAFLLSVKTVDGVLTSKFTGHFSTVACLADDEYVAQLQPRFYITVTNDNDEPLSINLYTSPHEIFDPHSLTPLAAHSSVKIYLDSWLGGCPSSPGVNATGFWISGGLLSQGYGAYAGWESVDGRVASQFLLLPYHVVGSRYAATPCGRTILRSVLNSRPRIFAWASDDTDESPWPPYDVTFSGEYDTFYANSSSESLYRTQSRDDAMWYTSIATCHGSTFTQLPARMTAKQFVFMAPPDVTGEMVIYVYLRLLMMSDDTFVQFNNNSHGPVLANNMTQFKIQPNEGCLITSNNNIEVYYGGGSPYLYGQMYPENLFPSENVTFQTVTPETSNGSVAVHLLRLMVPDHSMTASLAIDGQAISAEDFRVVPNTVNYYYYDGKISQGQHSIGVTKEGTKYLGTVYAFPYDSPHPMSSFVVALDLPKKGQ